MFTFLTVGMMFFLRFKKTCWRKLIRFQTVHSNIKADHESKSNHHGSVANVKNECESSQ